VGSDTRNVDCNFEFGRSSTQNIIPNKTTTIKACSYVLPFVNENLITSSSLRVPTDTVGAINVTLFTISMDIPFIVLFSGSDVQVLDFLPCPWGFTQEYQT
jgi:hypothetical protein